MAMFIHVLHENTCTVENRLSRNASRKKQNSINYCILYPHKIYIYIITYVCTIPTGHGGPCGAVTPMVMC